MARSSVLTRRFLFGAAPAVLAVAALPATMGMPSTPPSPGPTAHNPDVCLTVQEAVFLRVYRKADDRQKAAIRQSLEDLNAGAEWKVVAARLHVAFGMVPA